MKDCPFCSLDMRTFLGFYWHVIFRHLLTGKLDEKPDQEPLPPLPAKDAD